MTPTSTGRDIDLRVANFRINGFTVFESALSAALIDTSEKNGSFELLVARSAWPIRAFRASTTTFLRRATATSAPHLKKGSIWMQGLLHPLHRGTPNRSDHSRPELRFVYTRPWYTPGQSFEVRRSGFGQLSERDKTLLASATLTD